MSVTPATIDRTVARWIEEAKRLPIREGYAALMRRARYLDAQMRRCAGPAWDLANGRERLTAAALQLRDNRCPMSPSPST